MAINSMFFPCMKHTLIVIELTCYQSVMFGVVIRVRRSVARWSELDASDYSGHLITGDGGVKEVSTLVCVCV